jgi:hypothetical protein
MRKLVEGRALRAALGERAYVSPPVTLAPPVTLGVMRVGVAGGAFVATPLGKPDSRQ